MRSPAARRMIQTRVRSVSDSSALPTQGFGFLASCANSAAMPAGHGDLSFFSPVLSSMLRAIEILRCYLRLYIAYFGERKDWGDSIGRVAQSGCHRRLVERPAERAFAAPGRVGRRYF